VFLSTHLLPIVEEIATKVGSLSDGDLVADGPPGEFRDHREIDGERTPKDVFLEATTEDEYLGMNPSRSELPLPTHSRRSHSFLEAGASCFHDALCRNRGGSRRERSLHRRSFGVTHS
jgi:ABC-type multidrug transport system ATPase subunit